MTHWFADLDPWLRWLLSASVQASVLVVLVTGVQLALGRWLSPSWRYALWGLVVVRLLMPIAPGSPWSVFNLMPDEPAAGVTAAPLPPMDFTIVTLSEPIVGAPTASAPVQQVRRADPITWSQLVTWAWAGGAMLFPVWVAGSHLRLSRRIALDQREPDDDLEALLQSCRQQMNLRRRVRVVLTDAAAGPALMGVFRPRILLPAHLVTALSRDQLRHVLMHELAHLQRHDIAINWLLIGLTALHWFNPLIWFAFHRLRSDREPLRDAMVLRQTGTDTNRDYGQTIVRVLEELTRPRLGNPALAGITESRRQMRRRIRLIADFGRPRKWLSAIGILALLFLAAIGLTDAAEPTTATEPETVSSDTTPTDDLVIDRVTGVGPPEPALEPMPAPQPLAPGETDPVRIKAYAETPDAGESESRIEADPADQATALANRQAKLLLQRTIPWGFFENKGPTHNPWSFSAAIREIEQAHQGRFVVKWNELARIDVLRHETGVTAEFPQGITLEEALRRALQSVAVEGDERPTFAIIDGLVVISTRADLQQAFGDDDHGQPLPAEPFEAEKNRRTAQKLGEPIPAEFKAQHLEKVLEYFRNVTGTNVWANWPALDPWIKPDSRVTVAFTEPVPARQALDLIVAQLEGNGALDGPAWGIVDGIVVVSTLRDIQGASQTRIYDIRDILTMVPDFRFDPDEPVRVDPTREEQVEQIVTLITDTVGFREQWIDGQHTIRELNGQLIVNTVVENHREIASLFEQLRETRRVQISFESRFVVVPLNFGRDADLELPPARQPGAPAPHRIIGDIEAKMILDAVHTTAGALTLAAPRVTQFSGQEAEILLASEVTPVQDIAESIKGKPKQTVLAVTEEGVWAGVQLKTTAAASPDRRSVAVDLHAVLANPRRPGDAEPGGESVEAELNLNIPDKGTLLVDLGTIKGPIQHEKDDVDEDTPRRVLLLTQPTIIIQSEEMKSFPGLLEPPNSDHER